MDHFAGLDVSVKETSICIVDDAGKIVREVKVASEPEALLAVLKNPEIRSHVARCLRDYPNGGEGSRRGRAHPPLTAEGKAPDRPRNRGLPRPCVGDPGGGSPSRSRH
jgi:hypothetical protein